MKINRNEILSFTIALIPIVLAVVFYSKLPDQIPRQWGIDGSVTYGSKNMIWLMTGIPLLGNILFRVLPIIDPRRKNYNKFSSQYENFILIFNIFILIFACITISESMYPGNISVYRVVPVLVGLLFVFIGNMMPKFKSNFFMGIKNPWTLSNEEIWNKTHRLGGIMWFFGGMGMILSQFIVPEKYSVYLFFIIFMIIAIVPSVMSYIWFKKITSNNVG